MENVQTYIQITTIAVCLLVLCQIAFLAILIAILIKLRKIVNNIHQTTDISKQFILSLREEQLKRVSIWKLWFTAFKQLKSIKH